MAIIKPINSGAGLSISLDYVLRGDKTETRLTSGLYCIPEHALEQMFSTKEMWSKTDGRQFKHFVQSFPPDEEVAPEKFIKNPLKMRFGIMKGTTLNKAHN